MTREETGCVMYEFQDDKKGQTHMSANIGETSRDVISIVVRVVGLFLLFVGMWVAIQVIHEALDLYRNPGKIERLAVAIEKGSNIDKSIAPLKESLESEEDDDTFSSAQTRVDDTTSHNILKKEFRLSYFIAWVIAILLLLLIARIALMAIKTGGELALYDAQIKRFAKTLLNESRRQNNHEQ